MWRRGWKTSPSPAESASRAAVRDQVGDRLEDRIRRISATSRSRTSRRPIRVFKVVDRRPDPEARTRGRGDSVAALAASAKKPSIAVLPFVNMSGDPEQEFFADGLTEDIITEAVALPRPARDLAQLRLRAQGQASEGARVAREFGVDYVAEGSVRKAGDRVRVTVQLIDGETEPTSGPNATTASSRISSPSRTRSPASIVATLFGRVEAARHDRAKRKPTDNMAAYECVLAAKVLHHRSNARGQRRGAAPARPRHRARPELCPCSRLEGMRCSVRRGFMAGATIGRAFERWIA